VNTRDLTRRIETCAGCHVGQCAHNGFPLRDVNHDLIAAGHPRLTFEFAGYQENQPKHWKPGPDEAAADFPARAWALGQLISAKAALQLLDCRCEGVATPSSSALPPALPKNTSNPAPWPEFAEYACFSCHHNLADERWRKDHAAAGAPPGAPIWGSWYFPMTTAFLNEPAFANEPKAKDFQAAIESLVAAMGRPSRDAVKLRPSVEQGIRAIDGLVSDLSSRAPASPPFDAVGVERLIDGFNHVRAWSKVASWDHAAQRYLALVPLNQARGRLDPERKPTQQALAAELRAVLEKLRFPDGYDSPKGFDPHRLR
jgi:hypothetical protein